MISIHTQASNLISDGSELLLLVPALAGVVGSVVLPVLGAVPDGAIVLFSGMGDDAQNQLTVGVGALGKLKLRLARPPPSPLSSRSLFKHSCISHLIQLALL